jgi:hypothetical protein
MKSERFLWIAGLALVGVLAGCGGETTTVGAPAAGDTPPANEAAGSDAVGEDAGRESLGSIEVEVNGEPRRFDIWSGSDTSLVPVVKALRIEGRGEEGDVLSVFANPVDLDALQLPATVQNQGLADLKPGQRPSSLNTVILQYTDREGIEYSSGPGQAIRIEDWSDGTLVGSFPGADLAARKGGGVKIGQGRIKVTFPH